MRTLQKNQQKMKYSLQIAEIPELEYYEDEDGNKYPMGILPNGKTNIVYGPPVNFMANISMSSGEAEAVEYGLSTADFEAVLFMQKSIAPIKEGSLIWYTSEPRYEHIQVEIDNIVLDGDYPVRESADYYVVSVRDSLDFSKIILKAINK